MQREGDRRGNKLAERRGWVKRLGWNQKGRTSITEGEMYLKRRENRFAQSATHLFLTSSLQAQLLHSAGIFLPHTYPPTIPIFPLYEAAERRGWTNTGKHSAW